MCALWFVLPILTYRLKEKAKNLSWCMTVYWLEVFSKVFRFFHFLKLLNFFELLLLKCWGFSFWSLGAWLSAFVGSSYLLYWMVVLLNLPFRNLESFLYYQIVVTNKQQFHVNLDCSFFTQSLPKAEVLSFSWILECVQ